MEELTLDEARRILQEYSPVPEWKTEGINKIDNSCDVSIIIPAYNAEKTIIKCVDSILKQVGNIDYKICIINDGSTDNTKNVLQRYKGNVRVEIIEQDNKGHAGARNKGLEHIAGKYIMFVDADDCLLNRRVLFEAYSLAQKVNADIVEFGYADCFNNNFMIPYRKHKVRSCENASISELTGFPWGKLIRAELFRTVRFPEGYLFEDSIMAWLIYPMCKRVCLCDNIGYGYRNNKMSISHTHNDNPKRLDTLYITELMLKNITIDNNEKYFEEIFLRQVIINHKRIGANIYSYAAFIVETELYKQYKSEIELPKELKRVSIALMENNYEELSKLIWPDGTK